jgi:hypothetical protein
VALKWESDTCKSSYELNLEAVKRLERGESMFILCLMFLKYKGKVLPLGAMEALG